MEKLTCSAFAVEKLPDLTDDAVAAAARWWADHVRNKTPHDNGDAFQSGFVGALLKDVKVDETEADKFEAALRAEIFSKVNLYKPEEGENQHQISRVDYCRARISTDYHPDRVLCNAIKACSDDEKTRSKIEQLMPWKSDLNITAVSVIAGAGYRSIKVPEWKAWDVFPIVGPEARFTVVDRWTQGVYTNVGRWQCGGAFEGKVALITLDRESVEPRPIALVLRGRVDVNSYYRTIEDNVLAGFRDEAYANGYLAIVQEIA